MRYNRDIDKADRWPYVGGLIKKPIYKDTNIILIYGFFNNYKKGELKNGVY